MCSVRSAIRTYIYAAIMCGVVGITAFGVLLLSILLSLGSPRTTHMPLVYVILAVPVSIACAIGFPICLNSALTLTRWAENVRRNNE